MFESFSTDQLLELYKIAIDEYRFEVKLNWDRTAYHLTLNSGLIAIATGLLKFGSAPVINLIVAGVFLVGFFASIIGIKTVKKGHEYYRRTVVKKTLFEDQLGLNKPSEEYPQGITGAVSTTAGHVEHFRILHDTEKWLKHSRRRGITSWVVMTLGIFCVANACGIVVSFWLYRHPPTIPEAPPAIRLILVRRNPLSAVLAREVQPILSRASFTRKL